MCIRDRNLVIICRFYIESRIFKDISDKIFPQHHDPSFRDSYPYPIHRWRGTSTGGGTAVVVNMLLIACSAARGEVPQVPGAVAQSAVRRTPTNGSPHHVVWTLWVWEHCNEFVSKPMSVCPLSYRKNTRPSFTKFSMLCYLYPCSVLFWWQHNTLSCISSFVLRLTSCPRIIGHTW